MFTKQSNGIDISIDEFKEKYTEEQGVVIDVRTQEEYEEGHLVKTDKQLDLTNGEFEESLNKLDKDKTYYLYCRTGNRSGQAARIMKNEGFKKVYNIGGFEDLAQAGFDAE
ncbi:rhodanese-like domain-containing protein [Gracilimonas sp. Q87]|uniref:rhodanese-like domain-containing protein n=1 Tax=Gracilimonas sp. Q87 TaxID=3384766 RepID=UPI003983EA0A